jgi:hypothetical protein
MVLTKRERERERGREGERERERERERVLTRIIQPAEAEQPPPRLRAGISSAIRRPLEEESTRTIHP